MIFNKKFKKKKFAKPNLISISEVTIFHEEQITEVKISDEEQEHDHTMKKLKALHEQMSTITNIKQAEQQLLENNTEGNKIEIEMVKQDLTPKSSEESIEEGKSTTSGSGEETGDDSDMV